MTQEDNLKKEVKKKNPSPASRAIGGMPKRIEGERFCQGQGCKTRLSPYNLTGYCSVCRAKRLGQ